MPTRCRSSAQSGWPTLSFDAADALLARHIGVLHQLIQRRVQKAARGVVTAHRVALGTEQTPQRQPCTTCLEVPQRHVEGADRLGRQAAAAHRSACPAQLVPQLGDIAGVLVYQIGRHLQGMGELPRAAGALGVAETQPVVTITGFDFGDQDCDLGHRLLPAGEHLRIADRVGQRQDHRAQAQPGDTVIVCTYDCGLVVHGVSWWWTDDLLCAMATASSHEPRGRRKRTIRFASVTSSGRPSARDTVIGDTPATLATSIRVGAPVNWRSDCLLLMAVLPPSLSRRPSAEPRVCRFWNASFSGCHHTTARIPFVTPIHFRGRGRTRL